MSWGNLNPVDELDIDQYKNISDDSVLVDSVAIDSTVAIDSIW